MLTLINFLNGAIRRIDKDKSQIVLDVSGVGYEVLLPYFVMRALDEEAKEEGDVIELEVYFHVSDRQPKPVLVGFKKEFERSFFEKLLQVDGIGVNTAAKSMIFSVSTIAAAIEDGDIGVLIQMPGITKRISDKMVATLRGKVTEWALLRDEGYSSMPGKVSHADVENEVVDVLVNLGHRRSEAKEKVEAALKADISSGDSQALLREVFRLERG